MVRHGLEDINLDNPIEGRLDELIECFVEFYGEKEREKITARLYDTKFYFESRKAKTGIEAIEKRFKRLEEKLDKNSESYQQELEYLQSEKQYFLNYQCKNCVEKCEREYKENCNELIIRHILKYLPVKNIEAFVLDIEEMLPIYQDLIFKKPEFITQNDKNIYQYMLSLIGNSASMHGVENVQIVKNGLNQLLIKENLTELKSGLEKLLDERNDQIIAGSVIANFAKDIKNVSLYRKKEVVKEVFSFVLDSGSQGFNVVTVDLDKPNRPLNYCFCSGGLELEDSILIHEMNHAVSSYYNIKNGILNYKTGFFGRDEKIKGSAYDQIKVVSDCVILNEVLNEYLALKISDIAKKNGIKLGVRDRCASDYVLLFPVFEDFFEEHIDEIKKCYLSENPRSFAEIIGNDNFDKLAKIADDMYQRLLPLASDENVLNLLKTTALGDRIGKKIYKLAKSDVQQSDEVNEYLSFYRKAGEVFKEIDKVCGDTKQKIDSNIEGYGFESFDFDI